MKDYGNTIYAYSIKILSETINALREAKKSTKSLEEICKSHNLPMVFVEKTMDRLSVLYESDIISDPLSFDRLIADGYIRRQSISKIYDDYKSVKEFSKITMLDFLKLKTSIASKILFLKLMLENNITFTDTDEAKIREILLIFETIK